MIPVVKIVNQDKVEEKASDQARVNEPLIFWRQPLIAEKQRGGLKPGDSASLNKEVGTIEKPILPALADHPLTSLGPNNGPQHEPGECDENEHKGAFEGTIGLWPVPAGQFTVKVFKTVTHIKCLFYDIISFSSGAAAVTISR